MTAKRYTLKGVNDEENSCVVCGKIELRRVMWIAELDEDGNEVGDAFHCGTTCGAKLLKRKISHINNVVKNFESIVRVKRMDLYSKRQRELGRDELLNQLTGLSWAERIARPQWAELKRIDEEAAAWADAQEIVVEL